MTPKNLSLLALQAPAGTGAKASPDERSTEFRPVEGGNQMQSGERLLVEAYVVIWFIVFFFVALMFRRQRRLDQRIDALDSALQRARDRNAAGE